MMTMKFFIVKIRTKINNMINLLLRPKIVLFFKKGIFKGFSKKIQFATGIIVAKDIASKNVTSNKENKII